MYASDHFLRVFGEVAMNCTRVLFSPEPKGTNRPACDAAKDQESSTMLRQRVAGLALFLYFIKSEYFDYSRNHLFLAFERILNRDGSSRGGGGGVSRKFFVALVEPGRFKQRGR